MWKSFPTALALVLTTTAMTHAQRLTDQALVDSGRDLYTTHCASCHGVTGRGNGPAAEELRTRPADLTQFAKPNGGIFNGARILETIQERASH